MTMLVKPTLNGLKDDSRTPNRMFTIRRMAVIISVVFFIRCYIWGGIGGIGGGHNDASAGTVLTGAQFAIPAVQTSVSPDICPCASIWDICVTVCPPIC